MGTTLVLVLVVAGYAIYHSFRNVTSPPPPPGCQAGTGVQAIDLDPEQAAVAATIASVAARHRLPRQAVTVALAAALQESKLHNLDYGDRDSVGIFQQRPSEGWGSPSQLQNPVYATTKFYAALTKVHGYAKMPVYKAAQRVQHSADGSAYQQWTDLAGQLTGYFTGKSPHGVSCWYTPSGQANLAGAERQIGQTFGPAGRKAVVVRIITDRSGKKNAQEHRGPARPAGRGLDGGQLAGRARRGLPPQRSTVCRFQLESREWHYGLAARLHPFEPDIAVREEQYRRWLRRHRPATRHTVLAGRPTTGVHP